MPCSTATTTSARCSEAMASSRAVVGSDADGKPIAGLGFASGADQVAQGAEHPERAHDLEHMVAGGQFRFPRSRHNR